MSEVEKLFHRSEIRYGLVGLGNTLVGLSVIYLMKWIGADDISANATGYGAGLIISFGFNSRWTFEYRGRNLPAFFKFLFVLLLSYSVNLATVMIAIKVFSVNAYVSQAMGVAPYTLTAYFGMKWFAFR